MCISIYYSRAIVPLQFHHPRLPALRELLFQLLEPLHSRILHRAPGHVTGVLSAESGAKPCTKHRKSMGKDRKIWENIGKYGKILEHVGKTWEKTGKSWKKWQNMRAKYGNKIENNVAKCGNI